LQVLHALVEPKLNSLEEVNTFMQNCGPAWNKIVAVIDEISGIDKEAIEKANAAFQSGGASQGGEVVGNGASAGGSGPDLHVRAGA
jgi:hypothetical protein